MENPSELEKKAMGIALQVVTIAQSLNQELHSEIQKKSNIPILSAKDYGLSKFEPDTFAFIAKKLGMQAEEILYIDDTPSKSFWKFWGVDQFFDFILFRQSFLLENRVP